MVRGRLGGDPEPFGELEHGGALEQRAVLQQGDGQAVLVDARHGQQLPGLGVALHIQPARRNAVAGQEVPQVVGLLREPVPDHPHATGLQRGAGLPGREQILDDRVQLLLRRIPGLEQVVVELRPR